MFLGHTMQALPRCTATYTVVLSHHWQPLHSYYRYYCLFQTTNVHSIIIKPQNKKNITYSYLLN